MLNNYIPEDILCTKCNQLLEEFDKGAVEGITWYTYQCPKCNETYTDEPDWDSMPSGVDDY